MDINGTNKGSVLMFVLVLTVVVAAAVAVVLTTTVVQARVSRQNDRYVEAFHHAAAAIDYVKYYVKASRYASNGKNEWLVNNSSVTGTTITSAQIPELATTGASVTIYSYLDSYGATPWYRIESSVPVPDISASRTVEIWVRERQPFSEYMFFVGGSITFGETTVAGKVHSNGTITYNRGCRNPGTNEPAKMWGETTSTSGYNFWGSGSFEELFTIYNDDGTVKYVTDHDFGVDNRPMPETNDINSLWDIGDNEGYNANTSIEFVTVQDAVSGEYTTKVILDGDGIERDLPANGVISCDTTEVVITGTTTTSAGTVYNVAGVNGRVTIVNKRTTGWDHSGQISISSPIIYIDKYGEPQYWHEDSSDPPNHYDYRTSNWFEDSRKDDWASNNFVPNPNYTGKSAVGLVSANDVVYGVDMPAATSLEIDAAIIANGKFGYDHDGLVKRNLRIMGSLTFNGSYGRYSGSPVTGTGFSYSGIYQYDQRLTGSSPPHFLGTALPAFFAWRVVN